MERLINPGGNDVISYNSEQDIIVKDSISADIFLIISMDLSKNVQSVILLKYIHCTEIILIFYNEIRKSRRHISIKKIESINDSPVFDIIYALNNTARIVLFLTSGRGSYNNPSIRNGYGNK